MQVGTAKSKFSKLPPPLSSLFVSVDPLGLQLAQVGRKLLALPVAAWMLLFLDFHAYCHGVCSQERS